MASKDVDKLKELRKELDAIGDPSANDGKPIEDWAKKARPIFKKAFKPHVNDFEKAAKRPRMPLIPISTTNSDEPDEESKKELEDMGRKNADRAFEELKEFMDNIINAEE